MHATPAVCSSVVHICCPCYTHWLAQACLTCVPYLSRGQGQAAPTCIWLELLASLWGSLRVWLHCSTYSITNELPVYTSKPVYAATQTSLSYLRSQIRRHTSHVPFISHVKHLYKPRVCVCVRQSTFSVHCSYVMLRLRCVLKCGY